ncbi:unnamed protein product [Durusdinium trenchii]|uniref:Uncharacterized protein n=1 Tax=Durusdinium trenchii TaxID=1381693 RepID=A0ABP0STZ7_9DINO
MSCHHKDPRPNIFSHQKRRTLGVCADFEFITEYSHVFGVSKPCETNLVDSLCGVVETSAFHPLVTASPHCFQPKTVCGVRRAWVVAWKALQIDAAKVTPTGCPMAVTFGCSTWSPLRNLTGARAWYKALTLNSGLITCT